MNAAQMSWHRRDVQELRDARLTVNRRPLPMRVHRKFVLNCKIIIKYMSRQSHAQESTCTVQSGICAQTVT